MVNCVDLDNLSTIELPVGVQSNRHRFRRRCSTNNKQINQIGTISIRIQMNKLYNVVKEMKKKMQCIHARTHTQSVMYLYIYFFCVRRFRVALFHVFKPMSKEIAFEFAHKNNFYLTAFNRCVTKRKKTR